MARTKREQVIAGRAIAKKGEYHHDPTGPAPALLFDLITMGEKGLKRAEKEWNSTPEVGYYTRGNIVWAPEEDGGGALVKTTKKFDVAIKLPNLKAISKHNIEIAKMTDIWLSHVLQQAPIDRKTGKIIGGRNYRIEINANDYGKGWGIFYDRSNAIRAFKRAGDVLKGAEFTIVGKSPKTARYSIKSISLFTEWGVENNVTYLVMNADVDWRILYTWYTITPDKIFQLSKPSYLFAKKLYDHIRINRKSIKPNGEFLPIPLSMCFQWMGIDQPRLKTAEDCIEEINRVLPGIKLHAEYNKAASNKDKIRCGAIGGEVSGESFDSLIKVSDNQKGIIEKIEAKAKAEKEKQEAAEEGE